MWQNTKHSGVGVAFIIGRLMALFFCFASTCCLADPASSLLATLAKHKTIEAQFIQVVTNEQGEQAKSTGTMRLTRPNQFYWRIDSPSNQLIIADGRWIWVYDKDLEQVIKRRQDLNNSLPAQLLAGNLDLIAQDYQVRSTHDAILNQDRYTLTTNTSEALFSSISLVFTNAILASMSIRIVNY